MTSPSKQESNVIGWMLGGVLMASMGALIALGFGGFLFVWGFFIAFLSYKDLG